MHFDFVLKNGTVITLNEAMPTCRWIAVRDGKIAALGERDDFAGTADRVVDLRGYTVLPGLADVHCHGLCTGRNLSAVDLRGLSSLEEVLHLLAQRAKSTPDGQLVYGYGLKYEALKEKRMPNRSELDAACPRSPCAVVHTSCHGVAVNTMALKQSGILDMPEIMNDCADQVQSGILLQDRANFVAQTALLGNESDETRELHLRQFAEYAASRGCTTVHSLDGGVIDGVVSPHVLRDVYPSLPIHALPMWQNWNVQEAKAAGLPRVGGCLCLDGARALFTAAYSKPFVNRPETRGLLYYSDIDVYNFVYEAHKNNMQIGMHAMGDRAIDQLIYIIDSVTKQLGDKGLRHRIEHFSYPTERHIELAAELQLALPMQPAFCEMWDNPKGSVLSKMLGEEITAENEPFAKLVKAGCMVGSSSDSPVTPIDPIRAMHILVNNSRECRRVSVTDALKITSCNAAWIGHEENVRGTLAEGKFADMTVVDRDPYDCPEKIGDTKVLMTISEGRTAYQSPDFQE